MTALQTKSIWRLFNSFTR